MAILWFAAIKDSLLFASDERPLSKATVMHKRRAPDNVFNFYPPSAKQVTTFNAYSVTSGTDVLFRFISLHLI